MEKIDIIGIIAKKVLSFATTPDNTPCFTYFDWSLNGINISSNIIK